MAATMPPKVVSRLRNMCITCDTPSPFSFSNAMGDSTNNGKNALATSGGVGDDITTTTITTVNLITQNATTNIINGDLGQFYTLEVVELRGFRLVGDTDFNGSNIVNINIDSGTMDNTIIGAEEPSDAYFDDIVVNGTVNFVGASGQSCVSWDPETEEFVICGSLTVQGPRTTIESTTVTIDDRVIRLSDISLANNDNKDRGIEFNWHDDITTRTGFMGFDNNLERFVLYKYAIENDEVYSGTLGDFGMDTLYVDTITSGTTNITVSPMQDIVLNPGNTILVPSNKELVFSNSNHSIHSNDVDLFIGSTGNINLSVSGPEKFINLLDGTCIAFGSTGTIICGNNGDLSISTPGIINLSDININTGSNLTVDCINYGTSGTQICGDGTDLTLSSTGCIVFSSECVQFQEDAKIFLGTTAYIQGHSGDIYLPYNTCVVWGISGNNICGSTGSLSIDTETMDITADQINLNTSMIHLPSESCIQYSDTTNICGTTGVITINTGATGSIELSAENVNLLEDSCINIGNTIAICGISGSLDISTTESITLSTNDTISLGSTGNVIIGITGVGQKLTITESTQISFGGDDKQLIYRENDTLIIGATGQNIQIIADNIDIPVFTEQQWVPYREFDITGTTGTVAASIAKSEREEVLGVPQYYWNFCMQDSGQFYMAYDITQNIRDANNKGFQLKDIYITYEVSTQDLVSISSQVIKHTMDPQTPGSGRSGSLLTVDESDLITKTTQAKHYPVINITSDYLSPHESLMLELTVYKDVSSVFKFHGIMLEFLKKLF